MVSDLNVPINNVQTGKYRIILQGINGTSVFRVRKLPQPDRIWLLVLGICSLYASGVT
jgi:hypothetical protein